MYSFRYIYENICLAGLYIEFSTILYTEAVSFRGIVVFSIASGECDSWNEFFERESDFHWDYPIWVPALLPIAEVVEFTAADCTLPI